MDWVQERGGIDPRTRVDLLGNEIVVVVPRRSAVPLSGPGDLVEAAFRHIALAGENVPAGRYAQAALESAGIWDQVSDRVVRAGNVRGALEWVALGETDAGVVYRTDATTEQRVRVAFAFPPGSHPPVLYPAAVLARASHPAQAEAFLRLCRGESGTRIFSEAGFRPLAGFSEEGPGFENQSREPGPAPLPDPWSAVRLSFWVALAATLAGFVPAVWFGWILARRDFIGKTALTTIALVPLVLPPVVTGFILLSILGTQSPLGSWMAAVGLPVPFTLLGATLAALAVGFPLYVISVRNAFQTVDSSYEAVAWTLGKRPWPTFLRVSFPLALPGIAAGAVLAFARALGEFGATVVLAGNVEGRTRTIALAVYTLLESPRGRQTIWLLVVASVVLSLLALLGFEALSRHQRRQMARHSHG
jgi:molybdate transport system permease protein